MNRLLSWPEPVVRVQHLSDSGIRVVPERYVKKPHDRPGLANSGETHINIPVIDMSDLYSADASLCRKTAALVGDACREWGFFQVVNHGVSHEMMARMQDAWRDFFKMPMEEKQKLANFPTTYEGYGSRIGVEKGISLDWSDYFFLHYLPSGLRDQNKWPSHPISCRGLMGEYCREVVKLGGKLFKVLSANLGLREDYLQEAFGGEYMSACMRVNYYPKCPQPDLTLGLSSHSDPGGMTLLLPDNDAPGLQVRHADKWVSVKPVTNAFIVNLGDQLQIISNANYKSVEHRVIVNAEKERLSLAFFYNPRGDILIEPAEHLRIEDRHDRLYPPMTFDEYRLYIRTKGLRGKSQVESLMYSVNL